MSPPSIRFFTPTATILSVTGRHAERYLQARLSNDVRLCSPNRSILAAALTPQGRTEALARVFKDGAGIFHLVLDGATVEALTTAIARFKVAEQVEITPNSSRILHVLDRGGESVLEQITGLTAPVDSEGATTVGGGPAGLIALMRRTRTPLAGIDLIAPAATIDAALNALRQAGGNALPPEEQVALRIEAKVPSFPEDVNNSVIVSEAGLRDAVSFTKGCYAGQEVIAKIDSLGRPPRILIRLSAPGEHIVPAGTPVCMNDKAVGKTTSSAFHRQLGVTFAFALLKNDGGVTAPTLFINGTPFSAG